MAYIARTVGTVRPFVHRSIRLRTAPNKTTTAKTREALCRRILSPAQGKKYPTQPNPTNSVSSRVVLCWFPSDGQSMHGAIVCGVVSCRVVSWEHDALPVLSLLVYGLGSSIRCSDCFDRSRRWVRYDTIRYDTIRYVLTTTMHGRRQVVSYVQARTRSLQVANFGTAPHRRVLVTRRIDEFDSIRFILFHAN